MRTDPASSSVLPLRSIRSLAIGSPNWLGDVVMIEPLLRALVRDGRFEVVLFCRPQVSELCAAFRRHLPSIEVAVYGGSAPMTRLAPEDTLWVNLAMTPDLPLLARRSGARVVWGYPRYPATALLLDESLGDDFVVRDRHHVHNYLSLLARLGIAPPDSAVPRLSAPASPESGQDRRIVVLNTSTSNQESKRYPASRFGELVDLLLELVFDVEIRLSGLAADVERNSAIALGSRDPGRCIDCSGRYGVGDLIAVLARSSLVISNDTGPMHIAAALGVPTIGIFGPTSPRWTAPLGPNAHLVRTGAPCAPCFKSPCPLPRQTCFDDVAPRDILRVVEEHRLL
jgi:lipopolysaccharide heptosyltransferase II